MNATARFTRQSHAHAGAIATVSCEIASTGTAARNTSFRTLASPASVLDNADAVRLNLPRAGFTCMMRFTKPNHRHYCSTTATYANETLAEQYTKTKQLCESKKLPPDVNVEGVFACNQLDLSEIQVYGFDYDYTLACYKPAMGYILYNLGRDLLYPVGISELEYDPSFAVRGLHYDIEKGLLMKLDSFLQIELRCVYKGLTKIPECDVLGLYKSRKVPIKFIDTNLQSKSILSKMMSEAILVTGKAFNIFEHELWEKFFARLRPSFILPHRRVIANKYVDEFYEETKADVNQKLDSEPDLHMQCDGWSNIRNEAIMNFIINAPDPVFVKFVSTESERHTGEYIEKQVVEVLEEHGPAKFTTLIGDNASNLQKALENVAKTYPHIVPLRCIAHTLNLLCQDILKLDCVDKLITVTNDIVTHIRGSQILNSLMKKRLQLYVKTRWCTMEKSLRSIINAQFELQSLVINPKATMFKASLKKIIQDDDFWANIKYVCDLFSPICKLITKIEGDKLYIHTIRDELDVLQALFFDVLNNLNPPPMFVPADSKTIDKDKDSNADDNFNEATGSSDRTMSKKPTNPKKKTQKAGGTSDSSSTKSVKSREKNVEKVVEAAKVKKQDIIDPISVLKKVFMERKSAIIKPIHFAAVILNPADKGNSLNEDEIVDGIAFISTLAEELDKLNNTKMYDGIMEDLANYRTRAGGFKHDFLWKGVNNVNLNIKAWWTGYCGHTKLAKIASKILTAPVTSAATERSFSTFSFVHSKRRNRLTTLRASKNVAPKMYQLADLFSVPEMSLLCNISEYFDQNQIHYHPEILYQDVKTCIGMSHLKMHHLVSNDTQAFLEKNPQLEEYLKRLLSAGKKLFLITNSPFRFVDNGMKLLLGDEWEDYFDVIIVEARKPRFFTDESRPLRIYDKGTHTNLWDKVTALHKGRIYYQGTINNLLELTGWKGPEVLYFGDHPYTDLADVTLEHGWRTGAILSELTHEIRTLNTEAFKSTCNWLQMLTQLIEEQQDSDLPNAAVHLAEWQKECHQLRELAKSLFNKQFGSVFRTHSSPTYFSRRLFRFADIYTSSVTNLMRRSVNHTFYPRRGVMPHEYTSYFV